MICCGCGSPPSACLDEPGVGRADSGHEHCPWRFLHLSQHVQSAWGRASVRQFLQTAGQLHFSGCFVWQIWHLEWSVAVGAMASPRRVVEAATVMERPLSRRFLLSVKVNTRLKPPGRVRHSPEISMTLKIEFWKQGRNNYFTSLLLHTLSDWL